MNTKERLFLYLYIIVSVIHLFSLSTNYQEGVYYSKWLLMPMLIGFFIVKNESIKITLLTNFILYGLFFSFLGDVFLLYDVDGSSMFFLLGLGAFLIGHVSYIMGFKSIGKTSKINYLGASPRSINTENKFKLDASMGELNPQVGLNQNNFIPGLLVLFSIIFLTYLMPSVSNDMKVPILVYALVITLMGIAAFRLNSEFFGITGLLIFIGAIFFILSDCILSTSLFKLTEAPRVIRICIMSTYILGQFLIATQSKQAHKIRSLRG